MSYKIRYNDDVIQRTSNTHTTDHQRRNMLILFMITCLFLIILALNENFSLQNFLPGDPGDTQEAITVFVDELAEGGSIGHALKSFCVEIINGAKQQ